MKKILFLIDNLGSGGAQRQMTTIAILLKRSGYQVVFLTYSPGYFFKNKLEESDIPICELSCTNILNKIFRIRSYIRNGKYDVVISFMDTPNFLNCFAALGGHKWRVITSERSCKESIFYSKKNKIFNWFQRFSDVIVCNSERSMKMWINHYPEYEKKIKVIYNTVQLPQLYSQYIPLKEGRIHIIVAASYQELKNPLNVIKALSLLSAESKDRIKVDWYGKKNINNKNKTKIYDESIRLIKDLNLSSCINLHSESDSILELMNQADLVGLFSTVEGLPNAICEAMMIGKPIIMTPVSDYTFLFDEMIGFLCEDFSSESIKKTFIDVLNLSEDNIRVLGNKANKKAENSFSKFVILNKWLDVINPKKHQ